MLKKLASPVFGTIVKQHQNSSKNVRSQPLRTRAKAYPAPLDPPLFLRIAAEPTQAFVLDERVSFTLDRLLGFRESGPFEPDTRRVPLIVILLNKATSKKVNIFLS